MINVRAGYWDLERCSWVGVDPVHVVPPLRPDARVEVPPPREPATVEADVSARPVT